MEQTLKKLLKSYPKLAKFLPDLLILSGCLIVVSPLIISNYHKLPIFSQSKSVYLSGNQNPFFSLPNYIEIKGVTSKIPVGLGHYQENEWQLTKDQALYLSSSGQISKKGNVVIYGHNTAKIFGGLANTKIGDEIELNTTSGEIYKYSVYSVKSVAPSEVEILSQEGDERITIFTCDGLFDSQRLVVTGRRIRS